MIKLQLSNTTPEYYFISGLPLSVEAICYRSITLKEIRFSTLKEILCWKPQKGYVNQRSLKHIGNNFP